MTNAAVFGDLAVRDNLYVQKDLHVKGVLYAAELKVDTITAKKLCLDDICITRDELKNLLEQARQPSAPAPAPAQSTSNSSTSPAPTSRGTLPLSGEGTNPPPAPTPPPPPASKPNPPIETSVVNAPVAPEP